MRDTTLIPLVNNTKKSLKRGSVVSAMTPSPTKNLLEATNFPSAYDGKCLNCSVTIAKHRKSKKACSKFVW